MSRFAERICNYTTMLMCGSPLPIPSAGLLPFYKREVFRLALFAIGKRRRKTKFIDKKTYRTNTLLIAGDEDNGG